MSATHNIYSGHSFSRLLHILLWCALVTGAAYGQAQENQPEKLAYGVDRANVPDAIAKVKSGEFGGIHVDLITRAGAVEAIPALNEQFQRVDDPLLRTKIASALVKLGDKDSTYWDYLVKMATRAVESDAPDFASPEFEVWMKRHTPAETEEQLYLLPGAVGLLALAGDSRAVPLLRQALLSPNHRTQTMAAMGLAELQDNESIPLIIQACIKASPEQAAVVAESLVYFDDNSAQAAVDQFIPKESAKVYRDAKAQGKKSPLSVPLYGKLPNQ